MEPYFVIGCSGPKLDRPAPAKDLYQGRVFKAGRRAAEASGMPWAVLSARYGFLRPDDVVDPYDLLVTTKRQREDLYRLLATQDVPPALLFVPNDYAVAYRWCGVKTVNWLGTRPRGQGQMASLFGRIAAGAVDLSGSVRRVQ